MRGTLQEFRKQMIVEASAVDPAELGKVRDIAATLAQGSPLAALLQLVVRGLARGVDVTVFESDTELTPNDAADLLHMSRPHLLKFMDGGELTFHRVGTHRRIRMSDLMDFIDRRERAKSAIAQALGTTAAINERLRGDAARLRASEVDPLNAL
jgi:excisionase family DNA binding protein